LTGLSLNSVSGIWAVIATLAQISYEFEGTNSVGQQILWSLDQAVRDAIEDEFYEDVQGKQVRNQSPWTPAGRECEAAFIDFLVEVDKNVAGIPHSGTKPIQSICDALAVLEKGANPAADIAKFGDEAARDELRAAVWKRLMKHSEFDWWQHGCLVRAVSIGMKDMWEQTDYRALQFILKEARHLKDSTSANEVPLGWMRSLLDLSGPHTAKILGDSDTFRVLAVRLQKVRRFTLPRFSSELMEISHEYKARKSGVDRAQLKLFSVVTALLFAVFNALMKRWWPDVVEIYSQTTNSTY